MVSRAHTLYIPQGICLAYRVELGYLRQWLPSPLQPKAFNGYGLATFHVAQVAGVSISDPLRLTLPGSWNAAIRIPVQWESHFRQYEGVYVPQRFTRSRFLSWNPMGMVQGAPFQHARFQFKEKDNQYRLQFRSGQLSLNVKAQETRHFPLESVLDSLDRAAWLYARPGLALSPRPQGSVFEQTEGHAIDGLIQVLNVTELQTNFGAESNGLFAPGAFHFDHALLLSQVRERWQPMEYLVRPRPLHLDPRFPDWQRQWTGNSDAERTR